MDTPRPLEGHKNRMTFTPRLKGQPRVQLGCAHREQVYLNRGDLQPPRGQPCYEATQHDVRHGKGRLLLIRVAERNELPHTRGVSASGVGRTPRAAVKSCTLLELCPVDGNWTVTQNRPVFRVWTSHRECAWYNIYFFTRVGTLLLLHVKLTSPFTSGSLEPRSPAN